MADNTTIEWADATVNAINGCTRVSPGCGGPGPHGGCYAERLAATRLRNHPSRPGLAIMTSNGPRWTGKVHLHETELLKPLRWQRARRIFWNAHGDIFHPAVLDEWIDRVFAVCALTRHHTHMILTKRSERMRRYVATLPNRDDLVAQAALLTGASPSYADRVMHAVRTPLANVWLGVSVEDQTRADEHREDFRNTPAAVKFVSYEPALGPVDWSGWEFVNQIIAGGESGPKARPPHPDWFRSTRDWCAPNDVAFFFKQWGEWRARGGHVPIATRKFQSHICYLDRDTGKCKPYPNRFSDETMIKLGRKAAGRLLDGVEHNAFPGDIA